jgi:tRNA(fMet)-specific endonuclease VapC
VTRCELFAGRNTDEHRLRQTLDQLDELPVDRAIAESAGRIGRATQLAVADALIAATALEQRISLMTRNRRHFELVPGRSLARQAQRSGGDQAGTRVYVVELN